MAGIKGALTALIVAGLIATPAPLRAAERSHQWYRPVITQGKTFPILLSAEYGWLNWRDTYGAPRMRFNKTAQIWEQTGTHQGIDIFSERGTPVVTLRPGVVENLGWTFYSGWRVGIRGDDGNYYFYAHLLGDVPRGISKGAPVTTGQRLGSLGSSGYGPRGTADEFPPHLHFGLQSADGAWLNPQHFLLELYDNSISSIKASREQAGALRIKVNAARSRMYSPGAPPLAVLRARIASIERLRQDLQAALLLDG